MIILLRGLVLCPEVLFLSFSLVFGGCFCGNPSHSLSLPFYDISLLSPLPITYEFDTCALIAGFIVHEVLRRILR